MPPQPSDVRLRKIFLHEEGRGKIQVIRWGGTSRILTNSAGADAIRLMVRGLTLEQVKHDLAERYQRPAAGVDLGVLVEALSRADLVASVDGQQIACRRRLTASSLFKFLFRFHFKKTTMRLCRKYLPFSVLRHVSFALARIDWNSATANKADQALNVVRLLPALPRASRSFRQFRREYRRNFVWKMAEVQAIVSSTPEAVDHWMEGSVHLDGKEHLDAALSLGRGVILCPFRFGCPVLIPMTLIRAGYSLTQVTAPGGVAYAEGFAGFQKLRPTFGSYREVRDLSLARYRTILSALESGGLVVWLPDFTGSADAASDSESSRGWEDFPVSVIETSLPKARIAVPFCGGRIFMNRWVGAFAVMAASPVVPAALVRTGSKIRLLLQPPILPGSMPGGASRRAEAIDKMLFAELESFVQRYPAQWLAWRHVQHAAHPTITETSDRLVCAGSAR